MKKWKFWLILKYKPPPLSFWHVSELRKITDEASVSSKFIQSKQAVSYPRVNVQMFAGVTLGILAAQVVWVSTVMSTFLRMLEREPAKLVEENFLKILKILLKLLIFFSSPCHSPPYSSEFSPLQNWTYCMWMGCMQDQHRDCAIKFSLFILSWMN